MNWVQCVYFLCALTAVAKAENLVNITPCSRTCTEKRAPSLFTTPEIGLLETLSYSCNISAPASAELGAPCALQIGDLFQPILSRTQKMIYEMSLVCRSPLTVALINDSSSDMRRENAILYVTSFLCTISWRDMSLFGNHGDLRVLTLFQAYWETDDRDDEANYENDEYRGLRNLGTLTLVNAGPPGLPPRILGTYRWPFMAELGLSNFDLSSGLPDNITSLMPRLQFLQLTQTQLMAPPSFPWDPKPLLLPRNISRSPVFHDYYKDSLEFPNNIYQRTLFLNYNNFRNLSGIQPRGLLHNLNLRHNGLEHLSEDSFALLVAIQKLDLGYNKLRSVPENVFYGLTDLRELILSHNSIADISSKTFDTLINLKVLDLTSNNLTTLKATLLSNLLFLEEVFLADNQISIIQNGVFPEVSSKLRRIHLQNNRLVSIPEAFFYIRNLDLADLSHNYISFTDAERYFGSLNERSMELAIFTGDGSDTQIQCSTHSKRIINLQFNNITNFPYNQTWSKISNAIFGLALGCYALDMSNNSLHCDCNMHDAFKLMTTYVSRPILNVNDITLEGSSVYTKNIKTWTCAWPKIVPLVDLPESKIWCHLPSSTCPQKCSCYQRVTDGTVIVDCMNKGLQEMPLIIPEGDVELLLAGNSIKQLEIRPYLVNVTLLSVSENEISQIDTGFFRQLEMVRRLYLDDNKLTHLPPEIQNLNLTEVKLDRNHLRCDCNAKWLKNWLFNEFVANWMNLECTARGSHIQRIITTPDDDFVCETNTDFQITVAIAISLGAILLLLIIVLIIVYHYSTEIKVLMYFHFNWHPFDRVDDDDVSKIYDAFVSYSSQDYRWVVHQLRATLERQSPPYTLCVHDRDFVVGDTIYDNIMDSVQKSKRMIMVLSQNYVNSEWCMMEFRTAHQRVLQDRSKYLIVILLDGVDKASLDVDLQAYIKTNTYLEVDDKWFWKKLYYALPSLDFRSGKEDFRGTDLSIVTLPSASSSLQGSETPVISQRDWEHYKKIRNGDSVV